jgi:hypothetical protein
MKKQPIVALFFIVILSGLMITSCCEDSLDNLYTVKNDVSNVYPLDTNVIIEVSNTVVGGIRQQEFQIKKIGVTVIETKIYNVYMTVNHPSDYTPDSLVMALANKWNSMSDAYWCKNITLLYDAGTAPSDDVLLQSKPTAIASGNTLTLMNNYTNLLSLPRDGQFSVEIH